MFAGLVSKSKSEMEENGKMLGTKYDNGGVRSLRCNGEAFATTSGHDFEKCQRERIRRTMVAR